MGWEKGEKGKERGRKEEGEKEKGEEGREREKDERDQLYPSVTNHSGYEYK